MVASVTYTFLYAWNRLLFVLTFLTEDSKYNTHEGCSRWSEHFRPTGG